MTAVPRGAALPPGSRRAANEQLGPPMWRNAHLTAKNKGASPGVMLVCYRDLWVEPWPGVGDETRHFHGAFQTMSCRGFARNTMPGPVSGPPRTDREVTPGQWRGPG